MTLVYATQILSVSTEIAPIVPKTKFGCKHNPAAYFIAELMHYTIRLHLNVNVFQHLHYQDKIPANTAHHKSLSSTTIVYHVR